MAIAEAEVCGVAELGMAYKRQASSAEYLTDVTLTRAELARLLTAIQRESSIRSVRSTAWDFALAIAAINFAYYQADDIGFREPFIEALTGRADPEPWDRGIGSRIRTAVEDNGFFVSQTRMRFVGTVRAHAGLSFARIGQYSALIADLRSDPGWGYVRSAPTARLVAAVTRHFGRSPVVEEFLAEPQGVEFIRATCDVLAAYRYRLLTSDELSNRPGFRTGFLAELWQRLEGGQTTQLEKACRLSSPPRLMLDADQRRLFLRFDTNDIARRGITCREAGAGGVVRHGRLLVGLQIPPKRTYTGTRDDTAWEAEGWAMAGNDWALFDASGGMVAVRDPSATVAVAAGTYFAVCDQAIAPDESSEAEPVGRLELAGNGQYEVVHLTLAQRRTPPLPGLRVAAASAIAPRLTAIGGQAWGRWSEWDIVFADGDALPAVFLHGWTADAARRYRLIVQAGDDIRPIRLPPGDDTGGPLRIELPDLAVPICGRVWLQPIGRRVDRHPPVDLTFARFPACVVRAPDRLFGEQETVTIEVEAPSTVAVEGSRASGIGRLFACAAQPGQTDGIVTLKHGDFDVTLRIPVARARVRAKSDPADAMVLDADVLNRLRASGPAAMEVSGRASTAVSLWLDLPGHGAVELAAKRTDRAGVAALNVAEISDAIRSVWANPAMQIGRFAISETHPLSIPPVPTDSWVIGPACNWRALDAVGDGLLPTRLADPLRVIRAAVGGQPAPVIAPTADLAWLWQEAARWHVAASVLDGTPRVERLAAPIDERAAGALRTLDDLLKQFAASGAADSARKWVGAFDRLRPESLLTELGLHNDRWAADLRQRRERADMTSSLNARLMDFAAGRRVNPLPARSAAFDAMLHHYVTAETARPDIAREFYAGATAQYINLQSDRCQPAPVLRLGDAIYALSVLRRGGVGRALELIARHPPDAPGSELLRAVAAILTAESAMDYQPNGNRPIAFSRRHDDSLLAEALADPDRWPAVANVCWLGAWLGWRHAVLAGRPASVQDKLRQAALDHRDQMPACEDRVRVENELAQVTLTRWAAEPAVDA